MNLPLLLAGVLSLVATIAHFLTGERWIFHRLQENTLPDTPFGGPSVTKPMLRVVWHFVTIDFFGSAIALILMATREPSQTGQVLSRVISLHFIAYVLVGVAVAIRGVRGLLQAPQLAVFIAIAVLAWWGGQA